MKQPNLHEYGIHTENSDTRAHVSVINQEIYVYKTKNGLDAIDKYNPPIKTATQPGAINSTASGWVIPWGLIENIKFIKNPNFNWNLFHSENDMTTSEKGNIAAKCVLQYISDGRFPFWINADESNDKNIQIAGTDVIISIKTNIQIKCDWKCGRSIKSGGKGTGNLFLQKSECNPFKRT